MGKCRKCKVYPADFGTGGLCDLCANNIIPSCPDCGKQTLFIYRGMLGYEAVKCSSCGFEHNYNESNESCAYCHRQSNDGFISITDNGKELLCCHRCEKQLYESDR